MQDAPHAPALGRSVVGIKRHLLDNLRSSHAQMTASVQDVIRHSTVFPQTFNLSASIIVAGLVASEKFSLQGMLDKMIHTNFINTEKGNY